MTKLAPLRILLSLLLLCLLVPAVQAQVAFRSDAAAGIASGTPTFVDDTTATANASTLSINRPTATAEGNLLLAHIAVRGATTTITPPAGWTLISSTSSATNLTQSIYWRLVTATEPANYTWTFSSSQRAAGGILHIRDVNISNPIDVAGGQAGSGTTITAPSQIQAANNSLLVALFSSANGGSTHGAPGGMVEQYDINTGTGPNGLAVSADTYLDTTSGATGNKTATDTNSVENVGHLVVLRPADQNLTIAVPAGTTTDDVMIASLAARPSGTTIGTPAGWTLVRSTTQSNDVTMRLYTFRRVATASEPATYTWVLGGTTTTGAVGGIASFSGVDTFNPVNIEGGNTTTNGSWTHRANSVTTTIANTMLVSSHSFTSVTNNWTPPAGMTEMIDVASQARPNTAGMSLEMNYVAQAAAGATGNKDAVADGTGTDLGYGAAHLMALRRATLMTIANASTTEGNTGTKTLSFTVSLNQNAASATSATYALSDGTATGGAACAAGIDFVNTGGTVNIASGSSTGTISVTLCGDTTYEANETFTVTLSSPVNAVLGTPSSATGTLTNDDSQPVLTIANASIAEGNSGTTTLSFTVTLSNDSYQTVSVNYATSGGTATGGASCSGSTDYVTASNTLNVVAGALAGTIDVTLCGDLSFEADETFTVTLSAPTNATLGAPSSATGTITNDDLPTPVAEYRFDECNQYTGAAGQVVDTRSTYPGTPMGGLQNATPGQIQRDAVFSTPPVYVNVPSGPALTNWTISTWFQMPFAGSGTHTSRYYNIGSVSGGGDFMYLDRNNNYRWGVYTVGGGGGVTDGTFQFGTLASGWHHLAIVGNGSNTAIYVDGTFREQIGRKNSGTFRYLGTSYDDAGHATNGQTFGTPLDEFKIFNTPLTATQVTQLYNNEFAGNNWDGTARPAAACGPHHLELQHGTGSGLTCAASTLTIRACSDAACSTLYTGGVGGTLTGTGVNWDGTTGGAAGAGFAIASGSSSVTKNFQPGSAGTVVLGTTSVTPTPSSATTCNFGSPTCTFTANTAGFIFSATTTGGAATIPPQVSGTATGTYYLRAVQASTTNAAVCTPAIISQNNVAVIMGYSCVDPATCQAGNLLTVNSTAVPATGSSVSLNFDANGSTPVTLRYDDVGSIAVTASKTVTPFSGATAVTLNGSSNAYVVKPHHFDLSAIQCGAIANPAAADATGAVFCKAGASFSATVTARNALGGATSNYGQETAPEGVRLVSALVGGLGLTNDPGISNATSFGSFTGGVATGTTFAWSEAGIITLTPGVGDNDYLGEGDVTGTTSGNVGRFYPDHFDLSAAALSPAVGTFSYMDQPFGASFTLTAKAVGGGTTLNYVTSATPANNFAKLDPTSAALWPSTTLGSTGFALGARNAATELSTRLATTTTPTGTWAAGVAGIAASLKLTRGASPDGPFDALDIGVAPRDSDGVTLQVAALDMDANGDASNERKKLGQTMARFGRLWLGNAYGSDQRDLAIPFEAQYWNGTAFVKNAADSTTSITNANIGLQLNGLNSTVNAGTFTVAGGAGSFILTKPTGATLAGNVDIVINLGATGSPSDCLGIASGASAAKPWLTGKWCGSNYDRNPTARASFGVADQRRGHIYLRESY